jgi:hypothetical protein
LENIVLFSRFLKKAHIYCCPENMKTKINRIRIGTSQVSNHSIRQQRKIRGLTRSFLLMMACLILPLALFAADPSSTN